MHRQLLFRRSWVSLAIIVGGCGDSGPHQYKPPETTGATATEDPTKPAPDDTTTSEPATTDDSTTAGTTTTGEPTTGEPATTEVATTEALTSTTEPPATCGNGTLEPGESCDDGNLDETDACTTLCLAPSCSDGLQSGDETDQDCGGSCGGCAIGLHCSGDGDCASGACEADQCVKGCVPWARQWGTPSSDAGTDVVVDDADNIYVSLYLDGAETGAVRKLDASGKELWTREIDTTSDDTASGITKDSVGNILVVGDTTGALDGNAPLGNHDAFIVKYDSAGNKLWTRQFGGNLNDSGHAVATDAADNIFVVGDTRGTFDGNVAAGEYDVFVSKFDAQGVKQWTRQLGTPGTDDSWAVASDSAGNVFIGGYVFGSLDGQPWAGQPDAFLAKFSPAGAKLWVHQFGFAQGDYVHGLAVDDDDNLYVTGEVWGALDNKYWGGLSDIFVIKYDAAGVKLWTRQLGINESESGYDIAVDGAGDVLITGLTWGDFDGHASEGGTDYVIVKLDASGMKQWSHQFGTDTHDFGGHIAVLSTGMPVFVAHNEGSFAPPVVGGDDVIAALLCLP